MRSYEKNWALCICLSSDLKLPYPELKCLLRLISETFLNNVCSLWIIFQCVVKSMGVILSWGLRDFYVPLWKKRCISKIQREFDLWVKDISLQGAFKLEMSFLLLPHCTSWAVQKPPDRSETAYAEWRSWQAESTHIRNASKTKSRQA